MFSTKIIKTLTREQFDENKLLEKKTFVQLSNHLFSFKTPTTRKLLIKLPTKKPVLILIEKPF